MGGDSNQSIYQFRGANPTLFKNLSQEGYKLYTINVSVRCHPSISYYANKLVTSDNPFEAPAENRINYISEIDIDFLSNLSGGFFIICETNNLAQLLYERFKNYIELYYIKSLDINDEEYNMYRDLVDKILKYYYNYNNENPKKIYSKEDFYNFLLNINPRIKEVEINLNDEISVKEYIKKICFLVGATLSDNLLNDIENKLNDDVYKYYYLNTERNNRVMTIHASKGLENNNVIVCLENSYNFNEEYQNKLIVALTRAKDNVYLYPTNTFVHIEKINSIIPNNCNNN